MYELNHGAASSQLLQKSEQSAARPDINPGQASPPSGSHARVSPPARWFGAAPAMPSLVSLIWLDEGRIFGRAMLGHGCLRAQIAQRLRACGPGTEAKNP